MKNKKLLFSLYASLFAALVAVATMIIKIPTPTGGYVNIGDGFVLLSGWMLGPVWGTLAAGIGSMLADLIGYPIYAPATFVIKALMVVVAVLIKNGFHKLPTVWRAFLSGVAAELVMALGYFLYEILLYGAASALLNVPFNLVQGAIAVVAAMVLSFVLSRMPLPEVLRTKGTLLGKEFAKKH